MCFSISEGMGKISHMVAAFLDHPEGSYGEDMSDAEWDSDEGEPDAHRFVRNKQLGARGAPLDLNDWKILRVRKWDWHDQNLIVRPFVDQLVEELQALRAAGPQHIAVANATSARADFSASRLDSELTVYAIPTVEAAGDQEPSATIRNQDATKTQKST